MGKSGSTSRWPVSLFSILLLFAFLAISSCSSSPDNPAASDPQTPPANQPVTAKTVTGAILLPDGGDATGTLRLFTENGEEIPELPSQNRQQAASFQNGSFSFRFAEGPIPFFAIASIPDENRIFCTIFQKETPSVVNLDILTTKAVTDLTGKTPDQLSGIAEDPAAFIKTHQENLKTEFLSRLETLLPEGSGITPAAYVTGARDAIEAFYAKQSTYLTQVQATYVAGIRYGSVSGVVREQNTNHPLSGVLVTSSVNQSTMTDGNGIFHLDQIPANGSRIVLNFSATGYASNQEILNLPEPETEAPAPQVAVTKTLKPVAQTISIGNLSERSAQATPGSNPSLTIELPDGSMRVELPLSVLRSADLRNAKTRRPLAEGESPVWTLEMTPVDPAGEREIFPGDFRVDPNKKEREGAALPPRSSFAEEENAETVLESVVMAEMTLRRDGEIVQPGEGESVPIRLRLPQALQEEYMPLYEAGSRDIPWWSYNELTGRWERAETQGKLVLVDGILYAEAAATHFSWWNFDYPITPAETICGNVYADSEKKQPIEGATVEAAGVDYQNSMFATTDADGYYMVRGKRNSQVKVKASYGDIVSDTMVVDLGGEAASEECTVSQDFVLASTLIHGRVIEAPAPEDPANATALSGVLVKASNGAGGFTAEDGSFSIRLGQNTDATLTASIIRDGLTYSTTRDVTTGNQETVQIGDVELDVSPLTVSGTVFHEKETTPISAFAGVTVTMTNGQQTVTDAEGAYALFASKDAPSLAVTYTAWMDSGIRSSMQKIVTPNGQDLTQDVTFKEIEAFLSGRVIEMETQTPLSGITVTSNFGKSAITDINGRYTIPVPAEQEEVHVTAFYADPFADLHESAKSPGISTVGFEGGTILLEDLPIDTRPAYIFGTVTNQANVALQGARVVTAYGAVAHTDPDGLYRIKAPYDRDGVEITFSYESTNLSGERQRWSDDIVRYPVTTGPRDSSVEQNASLTLTSSPPVITHFSIHPVVVRPGKTVTLRADAFDPEGGDLTYNWTGPVTADANTAFWTPTTSDIGEHPVFLTVTDNEDNQDWATGSISVKENEPPILIDLTVFPKKASPGESVTAEVLAYDPDQDPLTYTWSFPDTVIAETGNTVTFHIPQNMDPGTYPVSVRVTDPENGKTEAADTIAVASNNPPVVDAISTQPVIVRSGQSVTLTARVTDADNDFLTYNWEKIPEGWMVVPGSSRERLSLRCTAPAINTDTEYSFTFRASDGEASDSKTVAIMVVANNAPVIEDLMVTPANPTAGQAVAFQATATDPNGDAITYRWQDGAGRHLPGDTSGATYNWTAPSVTTATWFDFRLVVSDGQLSATKTFTVNVKTENNSPQITAVRAIPNPAQSNEMVDFQAEATDPDNDFLTTSWQDAEKNPVSLPWQAPAVDSATDFTFTATVSDGALTAEKSLTVTVVPETANTPPAIRSINVNPDPIPAGETATLTAIVTDSDQDPLSYSWKDQNDREISTTSTASWTAPSVEKDTSFSLTLQVTDNVEDHAPVKRTFSVTVDVNDPPEILGIGGPEEVFPGADATFIATVKDPDTPAGERTVKWMDASGATLSETTTLSWKAPTVSAPTTVVLTFLVSDGENTRRMDHSVLVTPEASTGGILQGIIRDKETQAPVSGALVQIQRADTGAIIAKTTTDATGLYRFTNLLPGTYYVTVAIDGYVQETLKAEIPAATP